MRKRAFTLAEALIALGVVGVVAALMLPMANKSRPDEMKVSYLKTYDSLSIAVNSIAAASKLYNPVLFAEDLAKTYYVSDYPLLDTYTKKSLYGVDCGDGVEAFGKLLKVAYKGEDAGDGWFETKDGKTFLVEPKPIATGHVLTNTANTANKVNLFYSVIVDLNGPKGVNALYEKGKSEVKPDRFKFFVLPNGGVVAADAYGQMYLDTRNNYKKLSDDLIASKLKVINEKTEEMIGSVTDGFLKTRLKLSS